MSISTQQIWSGSQVCLLGHGLMLSNVYTYVRDHLSHSDAIRFSVLPAYVVVVLVLFVTGSCDTVAAA